MNKEAALALERLHEENASCVVLTGTGEFLSSQERGVAPILKWLDESPDRLRDAVIADKVIGKAAALLMIFAGVREIYGDIVSDHALACLDAHGITCSFDRRVPYIVNRTKTGVCPMERLCLDIDDPAHAVKVLREALDSKK